MKLWIFQYLPVSLGNIAISPRINSLREVTGQSGNILSRRGFSNKGTRAGRAYATPLMREQDGFKLLIGENWRKCTPSRVFDKLFFDTPITLATPDASRVLRWIEIAAKRRCLVKIGRFMDKVVEKSDTPVKRWLLSGRDSSSGSDFDATDVKCRVWNSWNFLNPWVRNFIYWYFSVKRCWLLIFRFKFILIKARTVYR